MKFLLQKRSFDPLGMTATTFRPSEPHIARLAGVYGPNKEKSGYTRGLDASTQQPQALPIWLSLCLALLCVSQAYATAYPIETNSSDGAPQPTGQSLRLASAASAINHPRIKEKSGPASPAATVVSCIARNPDGKGYLEVDGKPFLYLGIQNLGIVQCLCDQDTSPFKSPRPILWLENVFEKTQALAYQTIQVLLQWSDIEHTDTPGVYDWTLVDKYIDWCNQYHLRLELLWTASNVCGGAILKGHKFGFRTTVPPYLQDLQKYFGDGESQSGAVHCPWLVGRGHDADARFMQDCEYKAVKALFNHLAAYDLTHRTIFFQVENEPNFHSQWRSNKVVVLNHLNAIGQAVKDAGYIVATRVNLTGDSTDADVNNLPYIDCVGADPYTTRVATIARIINDTAQSAMPYIAENDSRFSNVSSLTVTALVNGGFYDTFELNDNWCKQGIYDDSIHFHEWVLGAIPPLTPQGARMKHLNTALNKIGSLVAIASKKDMVGFNVGTDFALSSYEQTRLMGHYEIGFACQDASVGLAVRKGACVYCASDTAGSVTYQTAQPPLTVTKGSLDANGHWMNQGATSWTKNRDGRYTMTYHSQECLRIEFAAVEESKR